MPSRKRRLKPEEEPGRLMRVVALMDCVPGNSGTPDGPPMTILTIAHLDEIEQPMVLSIGDTERLLIKCLESLAHHKSQFADYLLETYFPSGNKAPDPDAGDDDDDDAAEAWKST